MEQQATPNQESHDTEYLVHDVLSGVYYRESLRQKAVNDLRAQADTAATPEMRAMWLQQADNLEAIHHEETQLPELFRH